MKLSALFVLAASTFTLADDPSKCQASENKDAANFVLVNQGINKHLAPLSKIFADNKKKANVTEVFNDGNHKMAGSATKLSWEMTKDYNDMDTKTWVPQGITSTADALEVGTYDGKDGWLVSWYSNSTKQVRISFVDKKTNKYRNALLVYPYADDDFTGVDVHAGGIIWYGDTLWVVDTYTGIRVFDMSNIWEVSSGEKVGKASPGKYSAAGYKYVIPQKTWYKWTPEFEFRFSYIALDRTSSPDRVMVGEYQKKDSKPKRMVQYELDASTRALRTGADNKSAKAVWASCINILRIQGAVQADKKIYISRSNADEAGDLWGWIPGESAHKNAGMLPTSPEDLSYDKRGRKIYGLTEAAGKRYIVTLDSSKVKFS